jgi:uncharacterized protein (DUF3084 family)
MNTTTKVFIVINLLLTLGLAFMAMTQYAYSEHWKRRWHKDTKMVAEQLLTVRDQIRDQSFRATRAEQARERLSADLDNAQANIKRLENDITKLETEVTSAKAEAARKEDTISAQNKRIDSLQESLDIARKRMSELNHIAQVSRAVAFQLSVKLAEVEDDLNNANTELHRRETTILELEQSMKRKDAYLALVQDRYPRVWNDISSDRVTADVVIRGVVAAVRTNPNGQQDLVMVTVGEDMDVQEGMEFIIYRGSQYIVKVRAERVLEDMVACRVITDTWNTKGQPIQQGDQAQNRLF